MHARPSATAAVEGMADPDATEALGLRGRGHGRRSEDRERGTGREQMQRLHWLASVSASGLTTGIRFVPSGGTKVKVAGGMDTLGFHASSAENLG